MASVTLTQVWVHEGSDLSTSVSFGADSTSESRQVEGQVREYMGGVFRTISRAGTRQSLTIRAPYMTRTDFETLVGWTGTTVMVRDTFGRKLFGTFHGASADENLNISTSSRIAGVAFTVTENSETEEV